MRAFTLPCLVLGFTTACAHTPVYDINGEAAAHGVLYYVQQQYDVKTLTYDQTFYELKVTGTFAPAEPEPQKPPKGALEPKKAAAEPPQIVRTVVAYARDLPTAVKYYGQFTAKTDNVSAWASSGKALQAEAKNPPGPADMLSATPFEQVPKLSDLATATGVRLTSAGTSRIQIPSTKTSSFQVLVPYGGSANGEIDLNADGTIGKGISQKQDQLPPAIAGALGTIGGALLTGPLTTVASHFLAPATAQAANEERPLKVEFTITPIHRLYTLTLTKLADAQAAVCGQDKWDSLVGVEHGFDPDPPCRLNLTVAMKRDDGGDDKKKDNNISINGSVTLPAPAASAGAGK